MNRYSMIINHEVPIVYIERSNDNGILLILPDIARKNSAKAINSNRTAHHLSAGTAGSIFQLCHIIYACPAHGKIIKTKSQRYIALSINYQLLSINYLR